MFTQARMLSAAGKGSWHGGKTPLDFAYLDSPISWESEERRTSTRRETPRVYDPPQRRNGKGRNLTEGL